MTLRDIFRGLVLRANAAATWAVGSTRKAQIDNWFADKYQNQPLVFGIVVTWLAFAAVPTATFAGYLLFWALVAFGVFWAILLFWVGLGLLLLVPALFVATGLAVVVFVWAAGSLAVATRLLALLGYRIPVLSDVSSDGTPSKTVVKTDGTTKSDFKGSFSPAENGVHNGST